MTADERTELLSVLGELARHYSDWRMGQIVADVAGLANEDVWDLDDEKLLQAARHHLKQVVTSAAAIHP